MADVFSREKRSEVMAAIRSSGNRETELAMMALFRRLGITGWRRGRKVRFEHGNQRVVVRPDFLFPGKKVAVFVDGEFWHGHPSPCRIPKARRAWWTAKIEGNKRRDRLQTRLLRRAGWRVARVWQHEIGTARGAGKQRRAGLLWPG